jgi:ribulose 1,5-bisphosphate synthetase/thiazole synthase
MLPFAIQCLSLICPALGILWERELNGTVQPAYDYIICGCGIAGLVMARRLSEDESVSVLCIEAGSA